MRRIPLLFLAPTLSIGFLLAQPAFINGPVEGFSFDPPTGSFRAVIGLPGSASFGPAILDRFDLGSVAPHSSYALAFSQGQCILVTALDSAAATASVAGVSTPPDSITWSGDGSVVILYSRGANWLQRISGLPGQPQVDPPVDLSPLGGSLAAVAIDRQGKNVALAIQGDSAGVYLFADGQNFVPAVTAANPVALTFSENGSILNVLDRSTLQLIQLTLNDWRLQSLPLDGLEDPIAIASGRDLQQRQVVFVASAQDQLLRVYDAATQEILTDLALDSKPTGIDAFGRNSFVVGSRSQATDPLWLFVSSPRPAVYFVPAARAASGGLE
jgi:hypothetical protein